MLVLVSGVDTVNKKQIGRKISSALNTFMVEDFTVDFSSDVFEIYNVDGKLVYRPWTKDSGIDGVDSLISGLINDPTQPRWRNVITPRPDILKRVEEIRAIVAPSRETQFSDGFVDVYQDYGIVTHEEFINYPLVKLGHPNDYADLVRNYKQYPAKHYVVTGAFSKHIIDRLRADLGAKEVAVVNIVRNPSVCFALLKSSPDFYTEDFTELMEQEKLRRGIWNAVHLASCDDIITVKYEDLGDIIINGVTIPITVNPINTDNILVTDSDVDAFNEQYSNFDHVHEICRGNLELLNSTQGTDWTADSIHDIIPTDAFAALGYTALSLAEIKA